MIRMNKHDRKYIELELKKIQDGINSLRRFLEIKSNKIKEKSWKKKKKV